MAQPLTNICSRSGAAADDISLISRIQHSSDPVSHCQPGTLLCWTCSCAVPAPDRSPTASKWVVLAFPWQGNTSLEKPPSDHFCYSR